MFGGPPPTSTESSGRGRGGYDRPQRAMGGGYRGRGGRGGFDGADRGGHDTSRGRGSYVPRGRGGRGQDGARGGRGSGAPRLNPMEREAEKQNGKASAIAETIAMMSKMKMEDNERKLANQK